MVEAQHVASTMKLVDNNDEQDLLEQLLEESKPKLPSAFDGLHYLLATPFRYPTRKGGSRFRAASDPGVFYGAHSIRTACAELGYWRHKFLTDTVDLGSIDPVFHTVFETDITASVVDLRLEPFAVHAPLWTDPLNYSSTQQFARVAREAKVQGILYQSVRDQPDGMCLALFDPAGFSRKSPRPDTQTWSLMVSPGQAVWRRDGREGFSFTYPQ
jgi:hypothetical protein